MRSLTLANSFCLPQRTGVENLLGYKQLPDNIRQIHGMLCLNLCIIHLCLLYHSHPAPSRTPEQDCNSQFLFIYRQIHIHCCLKRQLSPEITLLSVLPCFLHILHSPQEGLWFPFAVCVKCLAHQLFNQLWFSTEDVNSSLFKDTLILCQKKTSKELLILRIAPLISLSHK